MPGYSEIDLPEDLIWDNHNKALTYREEILSLHSLDDKALSKLFKKLEESELDNYTKISELIGIAFDENTVWGQLDIGELKCLCLLSLKRFDEAKEYVEMFMTFNDNSPERRKFYQALNALLDIELDEEFEAVDYIPNMTKMFGPEVMKNALGSISGEIKFYGLPKTNLQLEGLTKHLRLIESYKKLHAAKSKFIR